MHSPTLHACQTQMFLKVREKLSNFVIPRIFLLVAPADVTDWLILHSATLAPAISLWGLQAFLYAIFTFHVLIISNMMWKALFARDDLSVT